MIPQVVKQQLAELSTRYRGLRVYALIDGIQYQQYTNSWIEPHEGAAIALFAGTQDEPLAHAGPWLMAPDHARQQGINLIEMEHAAPGVLWLICWHDIDTQAEKLRARLNGKRPDGENVLVRFWDPRVIGPLYRNIAPQAREDYFGDAMAWHYMKDGKRLYINVNDHA